MRKISLPYLWAALLMHGSLISRILPDEIYLKMVYRGYAGKKLNLKNPTTFNEKLQWLKIHDRNPLYTSMVDKYEAKEYVANIIGNEYIVPLLGVWNKFSDIDFTSLPDRFVLKCTHDSGGVVICRDKSKFDIDAAKRKINKCLKSEFFYRGREWPYKNIKPQIIAEEYLEDSITKGNVDGDIKALNDYKFMCFNGKVKCIFVCSEREEKLKVTFFDTSWERLPFERHYPASNKALPKPSNFEKMISLAEVLSHDIPFVRVDFYECNGRVYFGELTFYPGDGMEEFNPDEWDSILGEWIVLPSI